jgi:hypothetical protein
MDSLPDRAIELMDAGKEDSPFRGNCHRYLDGGEASESDVSSLAQSGWSLTGVAREIDHDADRKSKDQLNLASTFANAESGALQHSVIQVRLANPD